MHSKSQNNTNHPSLLLNQQQNNLVFSLLGKRCYTLATAVVQLVLSEPKSLNKWSLKTTGVVCFVKDHPRKSYFIKVYDCDKRQLTWQQEIYPSFEYKTPRPYFHTFEAQDCIVGLNFASEQEAQLFKETILGKLKDREKRRTDRLRAAGIHQHNGNGNGNTTSKHNLESNGHIKHVAAANDDNLSTSSMNSSTTMGSRQQPGQNGPGYPRNGAGGGLNTTTALNHLHNPHDNTNQHRLQHTVSTRLRPTQTGAAASIPISTMQKSQSALLGQHNNMNDINLSAMSGSVVKSEKKKLNKRDIGLPTNFQHVTHVGFSPQTGFDLENVNPSMKKDLQKLFANSDDNQPSAQLQQQQQQQQQNYVIHQQQQNAQQYMHQSSQSHMMKQHQMQTHPFQGLQHHTHPHQAPQPPPPPPPPPIPPIPSPAVMNKTRSYSTPSNNQQGRPYQQYQQERLAINGSGNGSGGVSLQAPPVPPPPPPPRPLPPMPSQANSASKSRSQSQSNSRQISSPKQPESYAAPPISAVPPPPPPPPPPPLPGGLITAKPLAMSTPKASQVKQASNAPPPPPPMPSGQMDMHAALMSQVLKGKQLNHVDPEKKAARPGGPRAASDDPRTALMNQIKAGVKLKTVSSSQNKAEPAAQPVAAGGLAGALAKALQERGKVLQQTDESSSESEDDDDDEWDDAS